MIKLLTCSKEFENIKLRRTEKMKLNILNKSKLPDAVIRFPIEEGINTHENKINWWVYFKKNKNLVLFCLHN